MIAELGEVYGGLGRTTELARRLKGCGTLVFKVEVESFRIAN